MYKNMKGLLQRVMELSDCGRCLDDMSFEGSTLPAEGNVPDMRRLHRMF